MYTKTIKNRLNIMQIKSCDVSVCLLLSLYNILIRISLLFSCAVLKIKSFIVHGSVLLG